MQQFIDEMRQDKREKLPKIKKINKSHDTVGRDVDRRKHLRWSRAMAMYAIIESNLYQ